jgi:D-alanyl-lipoteichoic acid acyltransferase DltB (MBOAT superfamily)
VLFNSWQFAVFFPIVTLAYFLSPQAVRVGVLLVASCIFYMAFVPKYILILAFLILFDFTAGLLIERAEGWRRRAFLVASLCANIGMLSVFKYFNFFNANLAELARFLGWHYSISYLHIILPIGLSFHTFQSMSYTVEVYRKKTPAERSLLYFALYVMFYPQLVAGPIERPQNLLHQFREYHRFDWSRCKVGLRLMALGLFKKIFIADRAAILVNAVYDQPGAHSGWQLLVATYFFAFQIYCDFSGYSSIALGAAKVMGIDLMLNFNRPYLAATIADFWRRWHISLSTWFRDYVYFPLGGSRCSRPRLCFNLAVVFLISGFWHGANWTFVIWGGLHAIYFIIHVLSAPTFNRLTASLTGFGASLLNLAGILLTFNLVSLSWVFFRAANLSVASTVLQRIIADPLPHPGMNWHPGLDSTQFALALVLIAAMVGFEIMETRTPVWNSISLQPRWVRWGAYYAFGLIFVVLWLLSPQQAAQPFIYFQF